MREIVIRPPKAFSQIDFKELWQYRQLFRSMVKRRIKTEFQQQYLAYLWPVFRPLLMVLLFTLFRNYSQARTGVKIPYTLYVYSGLILWFMFTEATLETATSIKQNARLIQKVYFPRIYSPLSAIASNFVVFSISIIPMVIMMAWYGVFPGWRILFLPVVLLQVGLLIFGIGCIFAALGVGSNDWDKLLGFVLYVGLFVSPVIYSPTMIPENAKAFYSSNPMVGLLMAFRSALFDGFPVSVESWLYSSVFVLVIAALGILLFQRAEKNMVDRL
jgi:lipopolysaccharide transport system permease protein